MEENKRTKNRWLKRLAAAVMAVMMIAVTVPTGVLAEDHKAANYKDGRRCNNTYRTYPHSGFVTTMSGGAHMTSEGITCMITTLVYNHKICCSVCGYVFGTQSMACTTVHSKCGTRIVNH